MPVLTSPYEGWIQDEGWPIVEGYGVADVRTLEVGPWPRLGGRGAYI